MEEFQSCINSAAKAMIESYEIISTWKNCSESFFVKLSKDIEVVRTVLLLTGCVHGIRTAVSYYLELFTRVSKIASAVDAIL
jgi:dynein heavy chain